VITAVGVGINFADLAERFVRETDVDTIMLAGQYSLIETAATKSFFPACREKGVAVIAAGVYESGILSGGANFRYEAAPAEIVERVKRIGEVCASYDVDVPAAALHYVLAHPDVTAVAIGARSAERVRQNAGYLAQDVPQALFDELAAEGLSAPAYGSAS
jgi:D-threo-aldose 1-dehydrogenase